MKLSIDLNEVQIGLLRQTAAKLGVPVEDLARAAVSDLLVAEDDEFAEAARRVLEKNKESTNASADAVPNACRGASHSRGRSCSGGWALRRTRFVSSGICPVATESDCRGVDAYPSLIEKAAALCYSLCSNHPFIDGNKRVAHAAMEVFLILNGREIRASVEEQEQLMLGVASGTRSRTQLTTWLQGHSYPINKRQ